MQEQVIKTKTNYTSANDLPALFEGARRCGGYEYQSCYCI